MAGPVRPNSNLSLGKNYAISLYQNLFTFFEILEVNKNTPLFYARDKGDRFFAILEGEVKICVPRTQEEIEQSLIPESSLVIPILRLIP